MNAVKMPPSSSNASRKTAPAVHYPQDGQSPIRLPKPNLPFGESLGTALRRRRTVRTIGARKLGAQLLSNLLFAACGVNRRIGPFGAPGVTAASASNSREVEVYVVLEDAAYRFDARYHVLVPVVREDLRRLAYGPRQPIISPDAPVQLVFVAASTSWSTRPVSKSRGCTTLKSRSPTTTSTLGSSLATSTSSRPPRGWPAGFTTATGDPSRCACNSERSSVSSSPRPSAIPFAEPGRPPSRQRGPEHGRESLRFYTSLGDAPQRATPGKWGTGRAHSTMEGSASAPTPASIRRFRWSS